MFVVMMRGCIWLQKYIVMSQKWLKRVLDPSSPAPLLSTHLYVFGVFTAASPQSSFKINEIHVNILEHTNLYRLRRDVMSFFQIFRFLVSSILCILPWFTTGHSVPLKCSAF